MALTGTRLEKHMVKFRRTEGFLLSACVVLTSFLVVFLVENIAFLLVSFFLTTVYFTYINAHKGAIHPACWFSAFYFAYATFYSFSEIFYTGVSSTTSDVIAIGYFAYLAFIIPVVIYDFVFVKDQGFDLPDGDGGLLIILFLNIICLLSALFIATQGLTSKREVMDSLGGSTLSFMLSFFVLLSVALFNSQMNHFLRHNKFSFMSFWYILSLAVLLFGYGVTGERDYIFRYAFMVYIFLFTFSRKFRFYYPFGALFLLVLLLPLSQSFKGFLLSEQEAGTTSLDIKLFEGEFISAGRNLDYIVSLDLDDMHGVTYLWDLKRSLVPGSEQMSTGKWFNEYLRVKYGNSGESGWGFSLVAEGYLNFGLVGVFIQYFVLSMITLFVYRLSHRGRYFLLYYLFYAASFVYVQRADFANYIGFCLKVNLIFVFFLYAINRLQHFFIGKRAAKV